MTDYGDIQLQLKATEELATEEQSYPNWDTLIAA